jgi:hypothetical protein
LLGLAQLLFLFEQRFGAAARLIGIHAQYWNSLQSLEDHGLSICPPGVAADQSEIVASNVSQAGKFGHESSE